MDVKRAKPIRFDYKNAFTDGRDDVYAFCLSDKFRRVLLQNAYRALWSGVWQGVILTDGEKQVIEKGIFALCHEEGCLDDLEENMAISVTVNPNITVGGCCSDDANCSTPPPWQNTPMPGGTPCYPIPPVNPPVNPVPPVPPPGSSDDEWDIYRCKMSNYAYDQIRSWLVAVGEVPNTLITIGAILTILWTLAPLALLSIIGVAVLELASLIWTWYALSEGIDEIADFAVEWWDERHQEIVCQFYDMTDPAITRTAIVNDFLNDLAVFAESRPWWVDSLAQNLQNLGGAMMPVQIFLAPWELIPPTGYVGAIDCAVCDDTPVDPGLPIPETYIWVPAPLTAVTFVPNNNTAVGHTDGEGIFTHAPSSPLNYHEVTVNVDVDAVKSAHSALDLHGMAVRVQQYGAASQYGNDGVRVSSSTGGALDLLAVTNLAQFYFHFQNDDTEANVIASEFAQSSVYGNGAMNDGKASFRSQTYGSVSPASMVLDVWYLASV